ncbi:MAG: nucleotidyltransferase domain-containing protein [Desulfobacterales bacterium]
MNPTIDIPLRKLRSIFGEYPQIAFAYLFGSQATGEQTLLSDVDQAIN